MKHLIIFIIMALAYQARGGETANVQLALEQLPETYMVQDMGAGEFGVILHDDRGCLIKASDIKLESTPDLGWVLTPASSAVIDNCKCVFDVKFTFANKERTKLVRL